MTSSFLKDKAWENMDWLNKAVEPYIFSFNTELGKLPNRVELSYQDIITAIGKDVITYSDDVSMDKFLNARLGFDQEGVLTESAKRFFHAWANMHYGKNEMQFFTLEVAEDSALDIKNKKLIGSVAIVKQIEALDEDMINEMLPSLVGRLFSVSSEKAHTSYVNEVMDILDCKEARSSTSLNKKCHALRNHLVTIFAKNEYNIKNVDLIISFIGWINSYCTSGKMDALANLSKLKCMVHNGHPIYSMKEVV